MSWLGWNRPTGPLEVPTLAKREGPATSTYWMDVSAVDGMWTFTIGNLFTYETYASRDVAEKDPSLWTFVLNREWRNETLIAMQRQQGGDDSVVSAPRLRR